MNWLDIVIICLCIVGLIKGLYDGMIKQIVAIVALVIGIYLCSSVAKWLFGYLVQIDLFPQQAALLISYLLGFALIVGIISLAGHIVHRLIDATPLSIFNHLIGGLVGLVVMVLVISLFFNFLEAVDPNSAFISKEIKVESRFYLIIKDIISDIFPGKLFDTTIELLT